MTKANEEDVLSKDNDQDLLLDESAEGTDDDDSNIDTHINGPAHSQLFNGDTGQLELATRRCLLQLLRGPCIEARRHNKQWTVLLREERVIASRLAELFLTLVVDREQQIAFTRQADTKGIDAPMLLKRRSLTFIDSALILLLRERLAHSDVRAQRAVISREEMTEHLALFQPESSTDHANFSKKCHRAIEKFKTDNLLNPIPSSVDRFEISPILKLIFPVEEIVSLSKAYDKLALVPRIKQRLLNAGADLDAEAEDSDEQIEPYDIDTEATSEY